LKRQCSMASATQLLALEKSKNNPLFFGHPLC
jgi:hypothetical protein